LQQIKRIIVSRTDRAGDLTLTLPVLRELKLNFSQAEVFAHVKNYTAPILRLGNWADKTIIDDEFPGILSLAREFKRIAPELIVIVHPQGRVLAAAALAGIPLRVGRASNLWQFLLNDRRVQKRSRNERHESLYNLNLLEGIVPVIKLAPPLLQVNENDQKSADKMLAQTGMTGLNPVMIHPGHGGSASNLSASQYAELVTSLLERQIPVLISLGPGEEHMQLSFAPPQPGKLNFLTNVPDLAILAGIIKQCSAFVSGSTGPMHLAAGLGIPVVAFFPPIPAMTPVRWGPTGTRSLVIMPEIDTCITNCKKCRLQNCMQKISFDTALEWLENIYNESTLTNK
jgi:ADP-heptose:LPS heptosyltransferase